MPKRNPEGLRALWHVLSIPFGVGIALWISPRFGVYLLFLFVATTEYLRNNFQYFHTLFMAMVGVIAREDEIAGRPTAALASTVGIISAWLIAPPEHFWMCVICLAIIDPTARLVGTHYGITPFPYAGKKTCEGFLGAVLAGAMAASAAGYAWPVAGVVGLAAATGEILGRHEPWWCDDNLYVPALVAVVVCALTFTNLLP